MKKILKFGLLPLVMSTMLSGISLAQSYITVKVGSFNPEDAKAGIIVGLSTGRQVDERVDFGLGADLFLRKFTQETTVAEPTTPGGTTYQNVQKEIDYSMYGLPIMIQLNIRVLPQAVVIPYLGLAGGYEIVFSREANYITGDKDNRLYGGFGWQVMLGGEYPFGSASGLLGEIFYNGCTVSRNKGSSDLGYPISEELDFSGLGFRVGVRLAGL